MSASPYDLSALAIELAQERLRKGKKPKRQSPYTLSVDHAVQAWPVPQRTTNRPRSR